MPEFPQCPKCAGCLDHGEGLSCEIVQDPDGEVIFEGDLGMRYCIGADGREPCGWSKKIGDWEGYERAKRMTYGHQLDFDDYW